MRHYYSTLFLKIISVHSIISCIVVFFLGFIVLGALYPFPYGDLSGGKELFLLVLLVDVVCGPLLTCIIFNPQKPNKELVRDIGLVVLIQVLALAYGVHSVWLARPLFLVMEVDRFKVIAAPDLEGADALLSLKALPKEITPRLWSGPQIVAIRPPKDAEERKTVLFESIQGGRDYAQRPEFYIPYDNAAVTKTALRAKPIASFVTKYPDKTLLVDAVAKRENLQNGQLTYLPVVGRKDWVAVLNPQGRILVFLPGDGF